MVNIHHNSLKKEFSILSLRGSDTELALELIEKLGIENAQEIYYTSDCRH